MSDDNEHTTSYDQDWLENTWLDREKAHTMLITEFQERSSWYRKNRPGHQPWILAFHYNHQTAPSIDDIRGGLWIPDRGVQEKVDYAGYLIHYALIQDLESQAWRVGIDPSRPLYSRADLSEAKAIVPVHRDMLIATYSLLRDQVEVDFNVEIQPE